MDRELFQKTVEILKSIPVDKWIVGSNDYRRYIKSGVVKLYCNGNLFVKDIKQDLGLIQEWQLSNLCSHMLAEIAVRTMQREFGVA